MSDSIIKKVFAVSNVVPQRSVYYILAKLMEEAGELAQEITVELGDSYKEKGKDGVIGEALDTLICCIDIIYKVYPGITEEEIIERLDDKLNKWKNKPFNNVKTNSQKE